MVDDERTADFVVKIYLFIYLQFSEVKEKFSSVIPRFIVGIKNRKQDCKVGNTKERLVGKITAKNKERNKIVISKTGLGLVVLSCSHKKCKTRLL